MGIASFLKMKYTTRRPSPPATPPPPPPAAAAAASWSVWPSCSQTIKGPFGAKEQQQTTNTGAVDCHYHDQVSSEPWSTGSSDDDPHSSDDSSTTSASIMDEESNAGEGGLSFKENTVLVVEAGNPYAEFRASIREMAAAHGLHDFSYLRELLEWYLEANEEKMHDFILEAFLDLLLDFSSSASSAAASSTLYNKSFSAQSS